MLYEVITRAFEFDRDLSNLKKERMAISIHALQNRSFSCLFFKEKRLAALRAFPRYRSVPGSKFALGKPAAQDQPT